MSNQFFRAEIQYDNNMGESDEDTLYIFENNSSDYMSICTKDGRPVTLDGTDSYIEMLRHVLGLENYEGCGESVNIKELEFPQDFEVPDKVIKYFFPSLCEEIQQICTNSTNIFCNILKRFV